MPFQQTEGTRYFTFEIFEDTDVIQGIFTRHGGVSQSPWQSLNVGGVNGDPRSNVIENRRRLFQSIRREVESLFDVWQVHSSKVVSTESPRPLEQAHIKADAILTNNAQVTLFMRFGDCVPIFIHDPRQKVVGIIHAGWQGTVQKIAAKTIATMQERYHSKPTDLLAGIGPSIGPDHYEVGEDVVSQVQSAFGEDSVALLAKQNGKTSLDLWKANSLILEQSGVKHIQNAQICTACHVEDWFSHRAERGNTGRFGAILALKMKT